MTDFDLKLTTKRALEYEKRTGNDIISKMNEVAKSGEVKVTDIVELFKAMGEGYTVEMFDAWNATFVEKATAIFNAIAEYLQGAVEQKN